MDPKREPGSHVEQVRKILETLRFPEQLDAHPWSESLIVQAALARNPNLLQKNPGFRLAVAMSDLFAEFMPPSPPRRGKRLDNRWGEFGILAAQYFAPFRFGNPSPITLREAWGKIDASILLFLGEELPLEQQASYTLVGNEPEIAPNSTISDWHRKGIENFTAFVVEREKHLSLSNSQPSILLDPLAVPVLGVEAGPELPETRKKPAWLPVLRWMALAVLLVTLAAGMAWGWKTYQLGREVYNDARQLQGLATSATGLESLREAGPLLKKFRQDVGRLRLQASPALQAVGPLLGWVPVYGADLARSAELLEMADHFAISAESAYLAAAPLLEAAQAGSGALNPPALTKILVQNQSGFVDARQELDRALLIKANLDTVHFSPRVRTLFDQLDPIIALMDDGLAAAVSLPKILGASSEGPKTYLVLVQNEDELRATGGYITSVGSFVIRDGELSGLEFEDSSNFQDWSLPYPQAPWQVAEYMNIPVILLRDANWSVDYPEAVRMVEFLYSYTSQHSVDGVIAMDQQALVIILQALGPLTVEGSSEPVTAQNVVAFMRRSKIPPPLENRPEDWYRKSFINTMASALLKKLLSGDGYAPDQLARSVLQALNERHILLQFDDVGMTELLSRRKWDGAVKAGAGDFLMSVDTNMGYNKTNALVKQSLLYEVDLTTANYLKGNLTLTHTNRAVTQGACIPFQSVNLEDRSLENWYGMHRCYYNYLRVYVPGGSRLAAATPHAIPGEWTMLQQPVEAAVDLLQDDLDGLDGFGTFLVVPGGETLTTQFQFELPAEVLSRDPITGAITYSLTIQKQSGTLAIPVTIQLRLPTGAQIEKINLPYTLDGEIVLISTNLRTDIKLEVVYLAQ